METKLEKLTTPIGDFYIERGLPNEAMKMNKQECVDFIVKAMYTCFDEKVVRDRDRSGIFDIQRDRFSNALKENGFYLENAVPEGLNESRYRVCLCSEDDQGFVQLKTVCFLRYVTGIYYGRLVQLKDEFGRKIGSIGRIG